MQEGSRNALLKILEEPPASTVLVLSTSRRGAMMPTILSRLRPYVFAKRPMEIEREVIRRVFRDTVDIETSGVAEYFESFLPVPPSRLEEAAVAFLSGADARSAAGTVLDLTRKFEPRSLFPAFLDRLSKRVALSLRAPISDAGVIVSAENCAAAVRRADLAVGTYNQSPSLALERLFYEIHHYSKAADR